MVEDVGRDSFLEAKEQEKVHLVYLKGESVNYHY